MALAPLAVPTTRPLSPPPPLSSFGGASSSDDEPQQTGSRSSTLFTASSSFHSALSRASAASDSDTADEGELADLATQPSFGRDTQDQFRRESETSEDTLGNSPTILSSSSRRTSTSFDKPVISGRKPVAAPPPLVTELSTAPAPAQGQTIGKGASESENGSRFGGPKRKPSLLQRVIKNLQPSSPSSSTAPPSPGSPARPSFESSTSATSMPAPKRSSSFASSFLTSPAKGNQQRKYVKVHSKNVSSSQNTLGKIFLAQTLSTVETLSVLTGKQMTDEPLQISANGEAVERPTGQSESRTGSRPPSPASAASPTSPSPLRTSNTATRPPIATGAKAQPSRRSSSGSTSRKQGGAGKKEPAKGKALWCLEWSYDGRYLATAGQDSIIRIYQVRNIDGVADEAAAGPSSGAGDASAVLEEEPCQVWQGHTDGVLSLCWSKNGFLASGSMDKVRCGPFFLYRNER